MTQNTPLNNEHEIFPDDVEYFMQMLDWGAMSEPKMVYLGLVDKEDYTYYKSHPDKACERRLRHPEKLIAELRAKGYRAVSIDSPEAADPSTIVVSPTGIRTPYLDPKTIKKDVMELLDNLIQSESVYPMSYPNPRGLTEEADLLDYEHNYQTEFTGYKHPHPDTVKAIMGRYGDEFREEMFQKAFENRISDDYLRRLKTKFGEERFVFSARSYGKEAHQNNRFNQDEGRMLTYGTTSFEAALRFSGMKFNNRVSGKFAFVEVFVQAEGQKMTREYGLETAMKPAEKEEDGFETMITKEQNPHLMTMMVFEDGTFFEIPKDDVKWQDFRELYREDYLPYNNEMDQRRRMCFEQVDKYGGLKVYDMFKEVGSVYREEERKREQEREQKQKQEQKRDVYDGGETEEGKSFGMRGHDFAGGIKKMRIKTALIKAEEAHENAEKVKRESKERQNEANKKKLNQRLKDSIAHLLDVVIAIKRQNPQNNAQDIHSAQHISRNPNTNQR